MIKIVKTSNWLSEPRDISKEHVKIENCNGSHVFEPSNITETVEETVDIKGVKYNISIFSFTGTCIHCDLRCLKFLHELYDKDAEKIITPDLLTRFRENEAKGKLIITHQYREELQKTKKPQKKPKEPIKIKPLFND